jgi:hypothetical protein
MFSHNNLTNWRMYSYIFALAALNDGVSNTECVLCPFLVYELISIRFIFFFGLENRNYRPWEFGALTTRHLSAKVGTKLPISGGRSVGIVRWRTKSPVVYLFFKNQCHILVPYNFISEDPKVSVFSFKLFLITYLLYFSFCHFRR